MSSHRFSLNACDLYVLLGIFYYLQNIAYPPGIIAQAIQLIMILWGIWAAAKTIIEPRRMPLVLRAAMLLIIMYSLYGLAEMVYPRHILITEGYLNKEVHAYVYLQNALNSFLPFFVFYRFYNSGRLSGRRIAVYLFLFLATTFIRYFYSIYAFLESQMLSGGSRTEFTNNLGYTFLSLIPYIFFLRRILPRYILLGVLIVFIIACMKRGAILIGGVSAMWFLLSQIKHSRGIGRKTLAIIFMCAIVGVATWYVMDMLANSDYFVYRLNKTLEGNSSNRDTIYSTLFKEIIDDPSLLHWLFGRGANSTVLIAGNYAHEDWLELMTNNGIIGVVLGISFIASLYYTAYKNRRILGPNYTTCLMMATTMVFMQTFFSMIIYQMSIWVSLPLAYLVAYSAHPQYAQAQYS